MWVEEDPALNRPPTQFTADFMNAMQEEIAGAIEGAGMQLSKADSGQLLAAVQKLAMLTSVPRFAAIPAQRVLLINAANEADKVYADEIYVKDLGEMIWTETAWAGGSFQGYRSPQCGRPVFGHTLTPLAREVDGVGGLLPKTAPYLGLLAYAYENGLVVSQATWTANIGAHYFVDVDANTFRVPDIRQQFASFRAGAPDPDTANARTLGSRQLDALQNITGALGSVLNIQTSASGVFALAASGTGAYATGNTGDFNQFTFNAARVARTSTETRAANVAYYSRIHI